MWCFLLAVLCFIQPGASKGDVRCDVTPEWLGSVVMSMDIVKSGFHRELVYEVHYDTAPHELKVLLVQKMPHGVYMDQYQLESLKKDTGLQVLLDSAVNLEDPAYVSFGFSALIFLSPADGHAEFLQAAVPVHGRYHRPSSAGGQERVTIEPPKLLLRLENCEPQHSSRSNLVVEAPCTIHNQSLCSWLEIQGSQVPGSVSLEIPVGNYSVTVPVCVGTVLATLLCCVVLFRTIWKHGIF